MARKPKKKEVDLDAVVNDVSVLTDYCVQYLDEQSPERERALEYTNGEMKDLISPEGRSQVVSQDIRAVKKKILPSIMAILFSSDGIVEYRPLTPDHNEGARDATNYVNKKVVPENDVEKAIYDAISDAMDVKTGILKWCSYEERNVTIQNYTNRPQEDVLGLFDDPQNKISDHEITLNADGTETHSFRLKRVEKKTVSTLKAIPRGNFLIYPGADSIEDSICTGERSEYTRAQLVELGFDKDKVWELSPYQHLTGEEDDDRSRQGVDWASEQNYRSPALESEGIRRALETVLVYEMYVRLDIDDDGIAEMYKVMYGEGGGRTGMGADASQGTTRRILLSMEQVTEAPYVDIITDRDSHQFEGHSLAEDVEQYQRIKTVLTRNILDNIYWQNNAQPIVKTKYIKNPEAIMNPEFGKVIQVDANMPAGETPIDWRVVPLFAQHALPMVEKIDQNIKDETGITDASAGLDPEAFQNTSATAAHLASEGGAAVSRMITRWIAKGLEKAFEGLLREVIANADAEEFVQINNEWQSFDPRIWDPGMKAKINTGLGTGTRERDMQALQGIFMMQREIFQALGPDNPLVMPNQFYNTLVKIVEAAGLPNADPYFTEPDPMDVQARIEQMRNEPSPEQQKMQLDAQMKQAELDMKLQLETADMQARIQIEEQRMQSNRDKEKAQLEADLVMEQARLDSAQKKYEMDVSRETVKQEADHNFKREEMAHEALMRSKELEQEAALEILKLKASMAEQPEDPSLAQGREHAAQLEGIMEKIAEIMTINTAPRKIIRDEMGDIIGSAPDIGPGEDDIVQ